MAKAEVDLTPKPAGEAVDVIETESPNPFVKLSFSAEGSEITIPDAGATLAKSTSATVDKTAIVTQRARRSSSTRTHR